MNDTVKHTVDGVAVVVTGASLMDLMPSIAALITGVYLLVRLYETETFQGLLKWVYARFNRRKS